MTLLRAEGLSKSYGVPKQGAWFAHERLKAVDGVSLELEAGRTLGIVGESGSGKSTLARLLTALEQPSEGRVLFEGQDLFKLSSSALRAARLHFQMVFENPMASLNPRHKAGEIVAEPLEVHGLAKGAQLRDRAAALLVQVGLEAAMLERYPHEFSGGQRQRLMIARAISTAPKLLVADEPLSSLDVSVQAQILELLKKLRAESGMAMVFISHDLRVVRGLCDEAMVMKDGEVVEQGPVEGLWASPRHPYTRELLASVLPLPPALRARREGRA